MYYTNDFIDNLITHISMAGGDEYVKIQAPNVVKMLNKDKLEYKKFGACWWAGKEALRNLRTQCQMVLQLYRGHPNERGGR